MQKFVGNRNKTGPTESPQMDPSTGANFTSTLYHDVYDFIDPKKLKLSGKNVLITGASRGVGQGMAVAYAQAGASGIILAARSSLDKTIEDCLSAAKASGHSPPKILQVKVDVTNRQDVEAAAKQVAAEFDHVDVLVNNAGYLEVRKPIAESDPDEWWKTWEINIKGVYLMSRAFIPLVLKSELKTIVNISSVGAHLTAAGASAYQTTKLAILRFTEFLTSDHGEQGLLAYNVHPGAVLTELASNMPKETRHLFVDTPQLCGAAVAWLTSERREWLADRYVAVTWDMQELLAKKDEIVEGDLLKVRMMV